MRQYDVIVVGFGLAGAVASIESATRGARTLVLDAAPLVMAGGTSLVSGGGLIGTDCSPAAERYLRALGVGSPFARILAQGMLEIRGTMALYGAELCDVCGGADFDGAPGAESIRRYRYDGVDGRPLVRVIQARALSLGVEVVYSSRVLAARAEENGHIQLTYINSGTEFRVVARQGAILASGGSAADCYPYRGTHGTPYARGDAHEITKTLGLRSNAHIGFSGPYYAFIVPGTNQALTPWPLYAQSIAMRSRLLSLVDGRPVALPDNRHHGVQRTANHWRRHRLSPAALVLQDHELEKGPLVGAWPDGHAQGWGRLRTPSPWSTSNERELAKGWISRLPKDVNRRLQVQANASLFGVRVEASILNTLGGLVFDSNYRVLDRGRKAEAVRIAGELASVFRGLYQGSANLTECVVSGKIAAAATLKGVPVNASINL